MDNKTENPLAFPNISLRDYFAGQALVAYVNLEPHRQGTNAFMAYEQADEMLKQRLK